MRRLLPPFLFMVLGLFLVLLHVFAGPTARILPQARLIGAVPLLLGLVFLVGARLQFKREDAEIMTFDTPRNFQTSGLFGWSRNPMYLGFALLLLAGAIFVNSLIALAAPLVFFVACQYWYIPFEERMMRAEFGTDFDSYAKSVRRWI